MANNLILTPKKLTDRYIKSYLARVPEEKQMPISKLKADARAIAQAVSGLYEYGRYMLKQIIPLNADEEWLVKHASGVGVYQKEAASAFGTISVKGNIGGVINADALLTFSDGTEYRVSEAVTLTGTVQEINLEAVVAGTAGNRAAGDVLSFTLPIPGIENEATVISIGGGVEKEKKEDLLYRYLLQVREPAHGGSDADWKKWALEVQGVTQCEVRANAQGAGTVVLYIMSDDGPASEQIIERCRAYLETVRPVTVKRFWVFTPALKPVDFVFSMLDPDTQETRNAVQAELADLFFREAETGKVMPITRMRAAISAAAYDYALDEPTGNVSGGSNEILTMGEITWPT